MSDQKTEILTHLNEQTRKMVNRSKKAKLQWVRQEHFVRYQNADKIMKNLEWVISQPLEPNTDVDSLSIIGESGTGKTTIVKNFKMMHERKNDTKSESNAEYHVVAHCVLPDVNLGLKGMYASILHADPFNYPVPIEKLSRFRVTKLEDACIQLLKRTKVRILFVDEIQHALGRNVQSTLNSLKRVVLLSGVPLVPVGTEKTEEVLLLDDQLADRCPVKSFSKLSLWEYGGEFRSFLAGYEQFLPFTEPSNLQSKTIATDIYSLCSRDKQLPNLRRVTRLIKGVSAIALSKNATSITQDHINTYAEDFL